MTFYDKIVQYNWDDIKNSIYDKSKNDVINALNNSQKNDLNDFAALISPAAESFIEDMAFISNKITLERFGKVMQLYIPLYLSNYCQNSCVYCGFNNSNKIKRNVLTNKEINQEIEAIRQMGYRHILLVTGDAPAKADATYLCNVVEQIKPFFAQIAIEVQPLTTDEYKMLQNSGVGFVCIYQETYNEEKYPHYHLKGKKVNYKYRLETPDRIGQANIQKIGLGALLGLEDWRTDSFYVATHIKYLEKIYWKTKYSVSLPRLRPAKGQFTPNQIVSDKNMVQLICAYRIWNNELDISLSTRESKEFRDNVLPLGITSMSAGSSTEPGGYANKNHQLEQFIINDDRTPKEISLSLKEKGYETVWKDWDEWM